MNNQRPRRPRLGFLRFDEFGNANSVDNFATLVVTRCIHENIRDRATIKPVVNIEIKPEADNADFKTTNKLCAEISASA